MEEIKKDKEVEIQNTNKISKIDIILTVITLLLIIIPGAIALKYYIEEKEREELLTVGYTEYDLGIHELADLHLFLDICPPEYRSRDFFDKYSYNWEKKELQLESGEYTEKRIQKFNNLIFCDALGKDLKMAAEQYGLSENNQITIEWVLTHPKETCEIISADRSMVYKIRRD